MKLFEYQGKELFRKYGIPIPNGNLVTNERDFAGLEYPLIIKAQVPIGGRGKAGGIKKAQNLADAKEKLSKILGMNVRGYTVKKVLAEEEGMENGGD